MKVQTTRFGELEVDKVDVINFIDGIPFKNDSESFSLQEFFIVDPGDQTLILWLQSLKKAQTAMPIIESRIFKPDYSVKLLPQELASLELTSVGEASIYSVLSIPKEDVTKMSANLKAPLVINNKTRKARQIVLQDSKLEIDHPMYQDLKKYISHYGRYSSDDTTRTSASTATTPSTSPADNTAGVVRPSRPEKTS